MYELRAPWKLITSACYLAPLLSLPAAAENWRPVDLPYFEYMSVAISPDGRNLLAGTYPNLLYASTNYGASWSLLTPPIDVCPRVNLDQSVGWRGLAISADGNTFVAGPSGCVLCVSTNAGATWWGTSFTDSFEGVACSGDGRRIVAVSERWHVEGIPTPPGSGVYVSNDGGITWVDPNLPQLFWIGAGCSADGKVMVAGANSVWVSTNSGATWQLSSTPGNGTYSSFSLSSDGKTIIAGSLGDARVLVSTDCGLSWADRTPTNNASGWVVAATPDASKVFAAGSRLIYRSDDLGITWVSLGAPRTNYYAFAASADGNTLFAANQNFESDYKGLAYLSQSTPSPRLSLSQAGGHVTLAWTLPSQPFLLQESSAADAVEWSDVLTPPVLNPNNLQHQLTLPISSATRFFRLLMR